LSRTTAPASPAAEAARAALPSAATAVELGGAGDGEPELEVEGVDLERARLQPQVQMHASAGLEPRGVDAPTLENGRVLAGDLAAHHQERVATPDHDHALLAPEPQLSGAPLAAEADERRLTHFPLRDQHRRGSVAAQPLRVSLGFGRLGRPDEQKPAASGEERSLVAGEPERLLEQLRSGAGQLEQQQHPVLRAARPGHGRGGRCGSVRGCSSDRLGREAGAAVEARRARERQLPAARGTARHARGLRR
jgi:hypothetical protein